MRLELSILCLALFYNTTYAMQTPVFQQVNSKPKTLSNLAEPIQAFDSFLGQDKTGPYVLTWRGIVFSPSSPVWVTIDGNLLRTSDYVLNVEKGEIVFKNVIKRTQFVNVKYGYYPEISTKNANPTLTSPLTIKLNSNSFNGFSLSAVNSQNISASPNMILGYNYKNNNFTSSFYSSPSGNLLTENNSVKLGYSIGSVNNFSANYEKSDKGFSQFAKSFGTIENAEKSSVSGIYSFGKKSNLTLKNNNFKSLNSAVENQNNSAQFISSGPVNIQFNYSNSNNVDSKQISTSNVSQASNLNSKIGIGEISYNNNQNESTINTARTVNNQETLSFKNNSVNFAQVNSFKIDPKTGVIQTSSNSFGYKTKLSGGDFQYNLANSDSNINSSNSTSQQNNYSLNFKGNKNGFTGLNFQLSDLDSNSLNNSVNTINNKIAFGYKTINFSSNSIDSKINGANRKDFVDKVFNVNLPTSRNVPLISYSSIDALKRNEKGILVGSVSDTTSISHNLSNFKVNHKFGQVQTYSADGKMLTVDNNTTNLNLKLNNSTVSSEIVTNNIVNSNSEVVQQEITKYNFLTQPKKTMPGFDFERIEFNSSSENKFSSVLTDKFKLTSKLGNTNINTSTLLTTQEENSLKNGENFDNTISISTPILGQNSNLNLNINSVNKEMPTGEESKKIVSLNLSPNKKVTLNTEQSNSKLSSASGVLASSVLNNKLGLSYNTPAVLLQTNINTTQSNDTKFDVFDYRAVVGNDKTFIKIDSNVKMRQSNDSNLVLNNDTSNTSINFNTSKKLKISGSYILNPEDVSKPGTTTPIEKRTLGLSAKVGPFDLNGTYSSTEHLTGTPADVIAKAGGFRLYGESGIRLGYNLGHTSFYSEMKDQFFYNNSSRGVSTYTLGFTKNRGERFNFSLSGTFVENKNNGTSSQDYRAEAKLGLKF